MPAPAAVSVPASAPAPAKDDPAPASGELHETHNPAVSDSTIRVDVGLLDKLMNLVGELVLARNQVLQFTGQSADSAFLATSQRLNLITTELQESVMKTRMQPIGNVWSKLPRVVRDLAATCDKQVRLEMEGKETELDKTIIEAIKDPLTHIVRNSVDHGIEKPEVRVEHGKPAEGCLKMRAYHEGGQVNIEITDDGGGIDYERVKQKAVQRGLITAEQAAHMSDHEILNLHLPARLFHRGESHECFRPRRRHGCGQDQHRKNWRHRGFAEPAWRRHHAQNQNSADAGHHPGA